jgi:transcriptional regulator with XRE-family HTH domain
MSREQVNRLKIVLAEEQKSNKWLAEQLGKDQATISKWVTNASQPDLKNLLRIAKALNVDVARLLNTEVINDDEIFKVERCKHRKSFLQPLICSWCFTLVGE